MAKVAFTKKKVLLTWKSYLELQKNLVKFSIWSRAFYESQTRTLEKRKKKYLESLENLVMKNLKNIVYRNAKKLRGYKIKWE